MGEGRDTSPAVRRSSRAAWAHVEAKRWVDGVAGAIGLAVVLGCGAANGPPPDSAAQSTSAAGPPVPVLSATEAPRVLPPPPAAPSDDSGGAHAVESAPHERPGVVVGPAEDAAPAQVVRKPPGLTRGVGDEADTLLALGDAAVARGDFERAIEHYRDARRKLPKHPAPIVGVVSARFGQHGLPTEYASAPKDRRVDELLKLLDQALRLDSSYAPALIERGQLLLIKGRAGDARTTLQRVVEVEPSDAEAHSALAVVALATGDVKGALEGFSRAATLDPNNPARLTNLGTTLMMNGDVTAAIGALERALALSPNDPRTLGDLGTALLASGKPKAALPHLLRAHELAPTRATFMSNLAYAYLQLDQLDLADQWCSAAIEADPKLGSAWINLGLVKARRGDYPGAKQAFLRAQALDPSDPRPKANLQDLQELTRAAP